MESKVGSWAGIADKDTTISNDWTKPREVFGFVMDVLGLNVSHIFELLKRVSIPNW